MVPGAGGLGGAEGLIRVLYRNMSLNRNMSLTVFHMAGEQCHLTHLTHLEELLPPKMQRRAPIGGIPEGGPVLVFGGGFTAPDSWL